MKGNLQEAEVVGEGACEDVNCMGPDMGKLLLHFIGLDFPTSYGNRFHRKVRRSYTHFQKISELDK